MNKTVWVLTSEYNEYDQYGEYFVAVFLEKPSIEEVGEHLFNGGGRQKHEDVWYHLREREVGKRYE